jgi:tRNA1(Val) A37 N6-methylase TrmN6
VRFSGKARLGFYPLPVAEAHRIRKFLQFPTTPCAVIDPCIGDGAAFAAITTDAQVQRHGIELDSYRAAQALEVAIPIVQGSCLDVHCPAESFSLLYLNPPYDWSIGESRSERVEPVFLAHTYRWLKPGGILVLVIPGERIAECAKTLAGQFRETRVYRLSEPECVRYKQVVVLAVRRSRRERERLQDSDITRARLHFANLARNTTQLSALPSEPEAQYLVPESGPVQLVHRGLPLDEIEDLLPRSTAYRQAGSILFAERSSVIGRPLTFLHAGHVGILACSGLLNGKFGSNENAHLSFWQSVKLLDKTEEEDEDGTITIRERESFSNELTLVFATGETAILK